MVVFSFIINNIRICFMLFAAQDFGMFSLLLFEKTKIKAGDFGKLCLPLLGKQIIKAGNFSKSVCNLIAMY